jgi:hypothetical protein
MNEETTAMQILGNPAEIYSRWVDILRELSHYQKQRVGQVARQDKLLRMVCAWLDVEVGRQVRLILFSRAFGREIHSSKELTSQEAFGVVTWCNPFKEDKEDGKWKPGENWDIDMEVLRKHYLVLNAIAKTVSSYSILKNGEQK